MTWWWSYLLMAVGVFGLWLAGRKSPWGWAVGLAAQVLWAAYAVVTQQWGFIVSAGAYGWVFGLNLRRSLADAASWRCAFGLHSKASTTIYGPGHAVEYHRDYCDRCGKVFNAHGAVFNAF